MPANSSNGSYRVFQTPNLAITPPVVRNFAKRGDGMEVPDLTKLQADGYKRFLQLEKGPEERDTSIGLESLLKETLNVSVEAHSEHSATFEEQVEQPPTGGVGERSEESVLNLRHESHSRLVIDLIHNRMAMSLSTATR